MHTYTPTNYNSSRVIFGQIFVQNFRTYGIIYSGRLALFIQAGLRSAEDNQSIPLYISLITEINFSKRFVPFFYYMLRDL